MKEKNEIVKKKNKDIHVRISENDLDKIKEKAQIANLTVSQFFIDSALKKNIIVLDGMNDFMLEFSYLLQEQSKYLYEINKIGVNINQIAHQCNLNDNVSKDDIVSLATFYAEILRINNVLEIFIKAYNQNITEIKDYIKGNLTG